LATDRVRVILADGKRWDWKGRTEQKIKLLVVETDSLPEVMSGGVSIGEVDAS